MQESIFYICNWSFLRNQKGAEDKYNNAFWKLQKLQKCSAKKEACYLFSVLIEPPVYY